MKLSKVQLNKLKMYQEYVRSQPTFGRCLWNIKGSLLAMVGLGCVGYLIAPSDVFRWLLVGFLAGLLWAAFSSTLNTAVTWPVLQEIVDWDKVGILIKDNEKGRG
jgi:hypothetical protein